MECQWLSSLIISLFSFYVIYLVIRDFYIFVIGSIFLKSRLKKYGSWAMITGCTGGLGMEYCRQLSSLGFNIVIIDKVEESVLNKVKTDLEKEFTVKVVPIMADFRNTSRDGYQDIFETMKQLDVGILINNAGVLYDRPGNFHKLTDQKLHDLININVYPPQILTHHFVQTRLSKKSKGLVIFMGSFSGVVPIPYISGYSATKGYISFFVKALVNEYSSSDIYIQALCPGFLATPMNNYSKFLSTPSILCPSPKSYVRHAICTFGMVHFTTGYYPFEVLANVISFLPEWIKLKGSKSFITLVMWESRRKLH